MMLLIPLLQQGPWQTRVCTRALDLHFRRVLAFEQLEPTSPFANTMISLGDMHLIAFQDEAR